MKLTVAAIRHPYTTQPREPSYEWNNIYLGLRHTGHDVAFFDFAEEMRAHGRAGMARRLVDHVAAEKPDALIFCTIGNELEEDMLARMRRHTRTLGFFFDDGWRREFGARWVPHFDAATTSDPQGVRRHAAAGRTNVFYVPFGVNPGLFSPAPERAEDIDVTFVGSWHPHRAWLLRRLRRQGWKLHVAGPGWPGGPVATSSMIEWFRRSRVVLNLSNSVSWDLRYLASSPRALPNTLFSPKNQEQIKGRHFEIPACGAAQVSYYVEGLESLFEIGKEVEVFTSPESLEERVAFLLENEQERNRLAAAGLERTLRDHTYSGRFERLFDSLGWTSSPEGVSGVGFSKMNKPHA